MGGSLVVGLLFGIDTGFVFGICKEVPGTPGIEGAIMELVCQGESPGLITGTLGMRGMAVPAGERGEGGGVGLIAQDGLPMVSARSLAGRLF